MLSSQFNVVNSPLGHICQLEVWWGANDADANAISFLFSIRGAAKYGSSASLSHDFRPTCSQKWLKKRKKQFNGLTPQFSTT